ncbi:MAG: lipid A biosynthesis lauroyl acyltransferase [Halanaerobium sp. 4-GBenrich]|jgi:KDO2-lipid IV(A) lauroyltransferase|uniref:KDO2-lipid IV(A) lauroyltransferase n=1 Tax=Halanaerobium congolense TaxID=54121 RepID=A0A1M7JU30_9FIRM|nr:lysophospholipid acyltransferase family protein [Halanaerobium congolense]KXS49202.1 MAG: lipid A biosynthesis lauroyl acyltransferase [Halanaerobium sp. T82-1]ODS50387.1 MAG: lipid A biosynthesis lauroyl acyltransferase [Halanaerobium sp. 4-GBenrich]OEG62718.1 MAG: lipid A biosynthesis acyltransferase [Halanaerobium sp. MDAL1]TDS31546.1 KDO2-lipid IV(A) lauroyltransferase [Halanaerobium congolense]SDI32937.1 KDO2-lipid IV(A) lauroyltransferase [Halanaerobium congolense]
MKNKIAIFFYNIIRFLLTHFPPAVGRYLGMGVAKLAYLITSKRRKIVISNLKKALNLNDQEAESLLKKVYLNLGYNFTEFLMQDTFSRADIEEMVEFRGLEYLEAAAAEGNGVILYTGHFGNWELLGAALDKKGFSIDAIAREQNNSLFDKKINQIREESGVGVIPKGLAVRKVFKSLKQNKVVAFLGDQDARGRGWKLNFFGRDASTYTGAVEFAQRTGAVIVPVFLHRHGWLKHELIAYPPRKIAEDLSESELKEELQDLVKLTEDEIRKAPTNWMWLHKRWKTYN